MLMRVAVGIHGEDIDAAIETYNLLSERYFTHASPTLFSAATPRPQLSRYLEIRSLMCQASNLQHFVNAAVFVFQLLSSCYER